jgi:uncharacterized membrane protein
MLRFLAIILLTISLFCVGGAFPLRVASISRKLTRNYAKIAPNPGESMDQYRRVNLKTPFMHNLILLRLYLIILGCSFSSQRRNKG